MEGKFIYVYSAVGERHKKEFRHIKAERDGNGGVDNLLLDFIGLVFNKKNSCNRAAEDDQHINKKPGSKAGKNNVTCFVR